MTDHHPTDHPTAVEADLGCRLAGQGPCTAMSIPIPAVLRWTDDDPWAVTLDFTRQHATWLLGWDLLQAAACAAPWHGWVGTGDVRWRRTLPSEFRLRLTGTDHTSEYRVDAADLCDFVVAVQPRQSDAAARYTATWGTALRGLLDGEPL